MKYLITGLGNIGKEYENTRHNLGFYVLDALAEASNIVFSDKRYGFVSEFKYKSRNLILLKPSTYVNRSGNAVRYYLRKEKLDIAKLLVIVDDVALPFGTIRLRKKGGAGGHNGLQNIIDVLGTDDFARLRFGIGNEFRIGGQIDYVLGNFSEDEKLELPKYTEKMIEAVKSFTTLGLERSMNIFNTK
ncbi:MAG TPA: aminoacyl-tRNA hydrolase [Bacteroidales bacterium]|jgi:PTH1 family peptidyl-tRNA hydrolase|nr:aminoacyl-tRNA hydrolase [Bacteroidales bacterium]MDD4236538.1 aminoacyl-tRNA hydrolase [Bacteroidales bacterium]HXK82711.1 aminoacyl-tRNA hydrolase [Bacteroidales bacterium]